MTDENSAPLPMRLRDHLENDLADRAAAKADILHAAEHLEETENSFNLRWDADMRAIKRWREAHPGKELVLPDHADLVVWLLGELEKDDGNA